MDWTKAKSILIVALIITNIILGFSLFMDKNNIEIVSVEMVKDTLHILQDRGIYVYTKVPRETAQMPVLEVEYDHIGADDIEKFIQTQNLPKQYQLSNEEIVEIATNFLSENGLLNENTQLEGIKPDNDQHILTYKNFYNEIPLEECNMTCVVKDGQILSIDRIWLNPIEQEKMKKKTIPATTALLKFASLNTEGEEIYITDIDLVYWLKTSLYSKETTSQDTALPAWRISFNEGEPDYILAFEK